MNCLFLFVSLFRRQRWAQSSKIRTWEHKNWELKAFFFKVNTKCFHRNQWWIFLNHFVAFVLFNIYYLRSYLLISFLHMLLQIYWHFIQVEQMLKEGHNFFFVGSTGVKWSTSWKTKVFFFGAHFILSVLLV